jgi:hypothetical protein
MFLFHWLKYWFLLGLEISVFHKHLCNKKYIIKKNKSKICVINSTTTLAFWKSKLRWYLTLQGDNSLKSVERFDHMMFVCRFRASPKMNIHKQNGRKNKIKMKKVLRGTNSDYFTWVLMWENNPLIFRKDYLFCFYEVRLVVFVSLKQRIPLIMSA